MHHAPLCPSPAGPARRLPEVAAAADGPRERFLRRPEVERLTGLSRSHIYRLMAEGRFPAAIQITPRVVAWLATEVEAWMAARVAEHQQRRASTALSGGAVA